MESLLALGCFCEGPGLPKKIQLMCPRAKQAYLSLTRTHFAWLLRFDAKKDLCLPRWTVEEEGPACSLQEAGRQHLAHHMLTMD